MRSDALSGAYTGYGYDDENRLTHWYYSADGAGSYGQPEHFDDWRVDYVYDGLGRLRQQVQYVGQFDVDLDVFYWEQTSATCYLYDGMRVIQERSDNNTPTVSYTRGTDLSGSLEGAGGIGGLLGRSHGHSGGNWSTHNFYHADGNGNITYLVNSSQTVAASYRYDSFGNTISSSGSLASANTYRFSSKMADDLSGGLYYYGYRWYAPSLQRWPNRDPIGELGGINLYSYVENSPISFFDPTGLWSQQQNGRPGGRPPIPDPKRPRAPGSSWFKGKCCNSSTGVEWALVDGQWHELRKGECTPISADCDGQTCGGGFYTVNPWFDGDCSTPGKDCKYWADRRWTPTKQGPKAAPPAWDNVRKIGRSSVEGNIPPSYEYTE